MHGDHSSTHKTHTLNIHGRTTRRMVIRDERYNFQRASRAPVRFHAEVGMVEGMGGWDQQQNEHGGAHYDSDLQSI